MYELSKPQKEAVETVNGQIILISCPGSGKTSTVVRRVKYMVEHGIPAEQILVLTFSNAAASEMKERFLNLVASDNCNGEKTIFATIHSFCFNVVCRAYNLNRFNILSTNDAWMIIRKGLDELKKNKVIQMEIRDPANFTTSCLREISVINNNGVDWKKYQAETCPTAEFKALYDLYEQQKQLMGKIDFDDMLKLCYKLMTENPSYLANLRQEHRYIIVDEYQDTNFLQRDILYLLAGEKANICVVGDDDQSIYKFRGARPEVMLDFSKTYPDCKQIYMDVNYRSEPCIVECAKRLIENNKVRYSKAIKSSKTGNGIIGKLKADIVSVEDINIAKKIKELNPKVRFEDMAILYRNNSQAVHLSMTLMRNKIPFHSNDVLQSPYQHWMFSDLLAYYRLAEGVGTGQDLVQVINKPNRFIPLKGLNKEIPEENAVIRCVLKNNNLEEWKRTKAVEQIQDFFQSLRLLESSNIKDFIGMVRGVGGYDGYLRSYAKYRNVDKSEFTSILDSYLEDIIENNITSVSEWKSYANSVNEEIKKINLSRSKEGVTISTMHRSKGLEWDVVFLLGANDGVIPSKKMIENKDLEEERRLFYVAATRAKRELYISYTHNAFTVPSRFIAEFFGETKKSKPKGKYRFAKGQEVMHKEKGHGKIIQVIPGAVAVKFDNSPVIEKFAKNQLFALKRV